MKTTAIRGRLITVNKNGTKIRGGKLREYKVWRKMLGQFGKNLTENGVKR